MMYKNLKGASRKKRGVKNLAIFVLTFATMLLIACSGSSEDDVTGTMSAGIAAVEPTTPALESVEESTTAPPTPEPTAEPTPEPTAEPTAAPTPEPTAEPTAAPTPEPTAEPTAAPTPEPTAEPTPEPIAAPTPEPVVAPAPEPVVDAAASGSTSEFTYILNTSTHKIHFSNCKSVAKIKPENYATTAKTIDELLAEGYSKCGNCWK